MKPSFFILAAAMCSLLFFTSCENKEDGPSLNIATGTIIMTSGGGAGTFAISCTGNWTATSDQPWCTVTPASGSGDAIVSVYADMYWETSERSAIITVTDGVTTSKIVVKQTGANSILAVAPAVISVSDTAGTAEIYLRSNTDWNVTMTTSAKDPHWCSINTPWGKGDDTLTVAFTDNLTADIRSATFTFKAGNVTQIVTLSQAVSTTALKVIPESITAEDEAFSQTIQVEVGATWTVSVSAEGNGWCTVSPDNGSGYGSFTVNLAALPSSEIGRAATVTVTTGEQSKNIPVMQAHYMTDSRDGRKYRTVMMPDGKWWMAENLAFTQGLVFNPDPEKAHGAVSTKPGRGVEAIGSYWAPGAIGATISSMASIAAYGALYTWETVLMVDGKWSDETKTSSVFDDTWIDGHYATTTGNANGMDFSSRSAALNTHSNDKVGRGTNNRGICPSGWRIPTQMEWALLMDKVDGDGTGTAFRDQVPGSGSSRAGADAGKKMKSTNTCASTSTPCSSDDNAAWNYHATNAGIDSYGFNATPAGQTVFQSPAPPLNTPSAFSERGVRAIYWSASAGNTLAAIPTRGFESGYANSACQSKATSNALSVRCIKD